MAEREGFPPHPSSLGAVALVRPPSGPGFLCVYKAVAKAPPYGEACAMAEREGFEPSEPFGSPAFQASALDQLCDLSVLQGGTNYATSP